MSEKTYDSPEYWAQQFRDYIQKDPRMFKIYGFSLETAEQHKNMVYFEMFKRINNHVVFESKKEKMFVIHDMKLINGEGIEREQRIERIFDIDRSKTGRISGNYFPKFFNEFIMSNNRNFYVKWFKS